MNNTIDEDPMENFEYDKCNNSFIICKEIFYRMHQNEDGHYKMIIGYLNVVIIHLKVPQQLGVL
jgi:hypothetical protein